MSPPADHSDANAAPVSWDAGSVVMEVARKEQEIQVLRDKGLQEMQIELERTYSKLSNVQSKFASLKADFQYNLGLLDERDKDLENYENMVRTMTLEASDKDNLMNQMRAELYELKTEVDVQRARAADAEAACTVKHMEVVEAAESEKLAMEEKLLRQYEEGEAQRRKLKRALAEAEDELERQRREMSQSFADHTRLLETEYKAKADEALSAADISEALAAKRMSEMQILQEKAEVLEAKLSERDREIHALRLDLKDLNRGRADDVHKLQESNKDLVTQLENLKSESKLQQDTLLGEVQKYKEALESSRRDLDSAKSSHMRELKMYQQKLSEAEDSAEQLSAELKTCHTALQFTRKDMEEKLTSSEETMQKQMHEEMQKTQLEQHVAEMTKLKESLWEQQTENASVRRKLESLQEILQQRKADIVRYKEDLSASLNREIELERKVIQAQLRTEQVADSKEEERESSNEQLIKLLTAQRDEAKYGMQELQNEVQHLRKQLQRQADKRTAGHEQPQVNSLRSEGHDKDGQLRISINDSAPPPEHFSNITHVNHAPSMLGAGSELPSPSTIASIPSSPDYARINAGNHQVAEPATTTSEHIAGKSSRGGRYSQVMGSLEKLIRRPPEETDFVRNSADSVSESEPLEVENHRLRVAVIELESQQERLKSTISMMRAEMEQQIRKAGEVTGSDRGSGVRAEEAQRENPQQLPSCDTRNAEEIFTYRNELARCRSEISRLQSENERLMEVGNELRAERNMMAQSHQQHLQLMGLPSSPAQPWVIMHDRPENLEGSEPQPSAYIQSRSVSAPAWPFLQNVGHDDDTVPDKFRLSRSSRTINSLFNVNATRETDRRRQSAGTSSGVPNVEAANLGGWREHVREARLGGEPTSSSFQLRPWDSNVPSPEKATQTYRSLVSGKASARELPSQREKLAKLKRRHRELASRPKTRNYNDKD